MAELCTEELLELLLRGDGGGSSGVHENPSLTNLHDPPLQPSSSSLPTCYTSGNTSGEGTASEAEMASWLCEIFDQEPRGPATATTTMPEGGSAAPCNSAGACAAASGSAECRHGRSSSGRRRSCSGKAAEQRRREKINDKLRTLQQLTPMCSKTDKASTLEEVIKYVKSLQHQVQVMSAPNGYAMPTPILPPPCMHLPAGDVLGGKAPPAMLPLYPVYPMVYARPHNGTPVPMPALAPYAHRHPGEPAGSGGARQQLLDPRRHLVPNDLITEMAYLHQDRCN